MSENLVPHAGHLVTVYLHLVMLDTVSRTRAPDVLSLGRCLYPLHLDTLHLAPDLTHRVDADHEAPGAVHSVLLRAGKGGGRLCCVSGKRTELCVMQLRDILRLDGVGQRKCLFHGTTCFYCSIVVSGTGLGRPSGLQ